MGQQQLILIVLAVLIVGIAIAAGLGLFSANTTEENKLQIINDLNTISALARKYRMRPLTMAGGAGSYVGFTFPSVIRSSRTANYSVLSIASDEITVVATSFLTPTNKITVVIDSKGKISSWTYSGDFQ